MTNPQTIILAGGQAARLDSNRPKALTEVGGRPIIEHLIARLLAQGLTHVSIALGAQQEQFARHFGVPVQDPDCKPEYQRLEFSGYELHLRLLATGEDCDTGGRLGRIAALIDAPFLLSWCDAVWDVDVPGMISFHARSGSLATLLAVHPPARYGQLTLQGSEVVQFQEKPLAVNEWINGGLFVLEPVILQRISGDNCSFERDVLPELAREGQLQAWRHGGFWHCMDTPADRQALDQLMQASDLA